MLPAVSTTHSEITLQIAIAGAAATSTTRGKRATTMDVLKHHIHHPMHKLESRRDVVRGFSPAWFTTTMGTGIVSILLYKFPYYAAPLQYISWGVAFFNLLLFIACCVLFLWRIVQYRDFGIIVMHPQQSMALGAIPMGLCTIVICLVLMLAPYNLSWVPTLALALWCIDVVLSVLSFLTIPFLVTSHQKHALESINATMILSAVPTIVAATGGAVVASAQSGSTATTIVIISYILWAMGLGIATMLLTLYLIRLILFKLPPKEAIGSVFIPLGPLGQASYGIQLLGIQAIRLFPTELAHIAYLGNVLQCGGFFIGLLLWALATWWFAHAIYSVVVTRINGRVPFNIGCWALIFPVGTFSSSTNALWTITGYSFFRVLAAILAAGLTLLWILVVIATVCYAWTGELFRPATVVQLELQDTELDAGDSECADESLEHSDSNV